jgi:leucyl-tRNA synthetase
MLNALERVPAEPTAAAVELAREGQSLLLRVLNPVVPHITHALWEQLGYAVKHGDILDAPWPKVDAAALEQDEVEIVLQVNGKTRGKVLVPTPALYDEEQLRRVLRDSAEFMRYVGSAVVKRLIVVAERRLVNVVV